DQEEATLYLTRAEALRRSAPYRHLFMWDLSQAAATLGAAGGWGAGGAPAAALLDADLYFARLDQPSPDPGAGAHVPSGPARAVQDWQKRFVLQQDDTSPAL